jgi:PTH2 family peptidyl-tRNA hydrolase
MSVKQVIVIRKDLKMRRGKEIAQGSHASNAWLVSRMEFKEKTQGSFVYYEPSFSKEEFAWLEGSFTKVCLQVNSEEELLSVYDKAKNAGLTVHLITDAGATEFNGVPTKTCLAIGPHDAEKIDQITGDLKLY